LAGDNYFYGLLIILFFGDKSVESLLMQRLRVVLCGILNSCYSFLYFEPT